MPQQFTLTVDTAGTGGGVVTAPGIDTAAPWRGGGLIGLPGSCPGDLDLVDYEWYYNYTKGSSCDTDVPFVPMIYNAAAANGDLSSLNVSDPTDNYLLTFNEPDSTGMTVAQAISHWPDLMATGRQLSCPATTTGATVWRQNFMQSINDNGYRVDFMAVHWYGDFTPANNLVAYLNNVHANYGLPIWLTEFSAYAGTLAENHTFIQTVGPLLADLPYLKRVGWFANRSIAGGGGYNNSGLVQAGGGALTTVGTAYKAWPSNTSQGYDSSYESGTVVSPIRATPNAGSSFTSWSGNLTGTTNNRSLTMNADKSVTATFALVSGRVVLAKSQGKSTASLTPSARTTISLGSGSGIATTSLALKAQTKIVLSTSTAVSTASLAVGAKTVVALNTSTGIATTSLRLAPVIGLSAAAVSTTTLSLRAKTTVSLAHAIAISTTSAALSVSITIPLGTSVGVSTTRFTLNAQPINLDTSGTAATSAASLALIIQPQLTLASPAATSATSLTLRARTMIPLSTSVAISTANLDVDPAQRIDLNASSGVSTASFTLKAASHIPLSTSAGKSTTSIAFSLSEKISLRPSQAVSNAALVIGYTPILTLDSSGAISTTSLVVSARKLKPHHHNFTIWKGADFRQRMTYYQNREATRPLPLSSGSATLVIKDGPDGDVLLTLATGNGITLDDNGNILLYISAAETIDLDWATGVYQLSLTRYGSTDQLLFGSFEAKSISSP